MNMKAMAMSQLMFCVTLLIFIFSMVMATENQQAKPTSEAASQGSVGSDNTWWVKTAWPELVGVHEQQATHWIQVEAPFVHVVVIPFHGHHPPPPPQHYDPHRVRVFVDAGGFVIQEPRIG